MFSNLKPQEILMKNRRFYRNNLINENIIEVSNLLKYILIKNQNKEVPIIHPTISPNHNLFILCGACDVISEIKGDEYLENLTGVRNPKTIREKINYFINRTGIIEKDKTHSLSDEETKNAKSLLSKMKNLYTESKPVGPPFPYYN